MDAPKEIAAHEHEYKPAAWEQYTLAELGQWVHLLHKRAGHRTDPVKIDKDLEDARNYWRMMGSHLDAAESA